MAPTKPTESNGTSDSKKPSDSPNGSDLPEWINEENFRGVLEENFKGFKKVLEFKVARTGGAGENYASAMVRVKTKFELDDESTQEAAFMLKIVPEGGEGTQMFSQMGLFPKEAAMYGTYLREFEQMYADVGKHVILGPKSYTFKNPPEDMYVLLEDLSPAGFKNVKRQDGLDKEHTESVLKMVAELHAASAVRHAIKGEYEESFKTFMFTEENRSQVESMMGPITSLMKECYAKFEGTAKYLHILGPKLDDSVDLYIEVGKYDPNEFNVIIHGDLWANNIMFRYNDDGTREQTMMVDFQMSRYASPAVDLFYFLLSSSSWDIKLTHFDDFVRFYHDNLIENLKLLSYPKKMPTLKQLQLSLLKYNTMAFSTVTGILPAVLLDPSENASIDSFFDEDEEAVKFKRQVYENPRYIKQLDSILPWLYKRGYLD